MSSFLKKLIALLIAASIIIIFESIYGRADKTYITPTNNKVVIIDAGHGGRDAGASGQAGVREKDINLEIAKKLKRYIEESGGIAIMIREEDNGLYSTDSPNKKREDMNNRKAIIKESNADLLISIHLNSFPQSKYYGAQVFYYADQNLSKWYAKLMQQELRRILNRNNDRVEKSTREYFILKDNGIPSVLVECGFLSNPEEERLLAVPEYQEKIAWSMFVATMKFLYEPKPASY